MINLTQAQSFAKTSASPIRAVSICAFIAGCFAVGYSPQAVAQQPLGCEGSDVAGDAGSASNLLTLRVLDETIEQAKAAADIAVTPYYAGISVSGYRMRHDGYRNKNAQLGVTCNGFPGGGSPVVPPRLNEFEETAGVFSGLLELDVYQTATSLFKLGAAVGYKTLKVESTGNRFTQVPTFAPGVGVRIFNSDIKEDGIQLDLYSLYAYQRNYIIGTASFGFGESEITNQSFAGQAAPAAAPGSTVYGGGTGETDYREYAFSMTGGRVFTLHQRPTGTLLADISGGLSYSRYKRDALSIASQNSFAAVGDPALGSVDYGDAVTKNFSGKAMLTLSYDMVDGASRFSPFVRLGIKHRFFYESKVTISNPETGFCSARPAGANCGLTQTFDLESDDTFYRVAGGLSHTFGNNDQFGVIELYYEGAGDSDTIGGRAQYVVKFNH